MFALHDTYVTKILSYSGVVFSLGTRTHRCDVVYVMFHVSLYCVNFRG